MKTYKRFLRGAGAVFPRLLLMTLIVATGAVCSSDDGGQDSLSEKIDFDELDRTRRIEVETPDHRFDMRTGNVMRGVLYPHLSDWLREISPRSNDASVVFRYVTLLLNSANDAVAPYHPTAVGLYSRFGRRPETESYNNLAPNKAVMYSVYRSLLTFAPHRKEEWRSMMTLHGHDPDDDSGLDQNCADNSLATPSAIGNLAAKCVLDARRNDGMNQFGDETPGSPFMDTTGYKPVNTAYELNDPSRWQPLVERTQGGNYRVQQFVTPQWADVEPYTGIDPRKYRAPAPTASDHTNAEAYKAQADAVLKLSADLTDEQKVHVEFFDNKGRSNLFPQPWVRDLHDIVKFIQLDFMLHMAAFDGGIVTWQEKARYDAVRPRTAISYLYGDKNVTAWGGPGKGTVSLPANQWRSYIGTADHPEYPSATACFCAAYAQTLKRYTGKEEIPQVYREYAGGNIDAYAGVHAPGSSNIEPGTTPARPVEIKFTSWTDFKNKCANSRLWGGVHFEASVRASVDLCTNIGNETYDYYETLLDGTAPMRAKAKKLAPDPLRKEPHWTGR